jgi:hypothetical protein
MSENRHRPRRGPDVITCLDSALPRRRREALSGDRPHLVARLPH